VKREPQVVSRLGGAALAAGRGGRGQQPGQHSRGHGGKGPTLWGSAPPTRSITSSTIVSTKRSCVPTVPARAIGKPSSWHKTAASSSRS
jgi:hypothetical protein